MQEEVDQKTIALSMKTGKLTAQVLQAALKKYLQHRANGKTVLSPGWKEIDRRFRSSLKTDSDEEAEAVRELPELKEGQTFADVAASVTEHFTTPPKPYTEAICCERGIRNRP